MKRLMSILLAVVILISLSACNRTDDSLQEPVKFYYCNEEISYNSVSGVICEELREGAAYHGELEKLLKDYLSGPVSSDLYSLLPSGTELISCSVSGSKTALTFSAEFADLSGVQLSTACSCIVLTLHAYAGIETVQFRVRDGQLENQDSLIIHISDIVLMDNAAQKEG